MGNTLPHKKLLPWKGKAYYYWQFKSTCAVFNGTALKAFRTMKTQEAFMWELEIISKVVGKEMVMQHVCSYV